MDPIDPGFGGGCGPCGHGHHGHHGHHVSPFGPGPNVSPFGPNVSPFGPNIDQTYHHSVQISDQTLVECLKSK